jgi:hypothetical protein
MIVEIGTRALRGRRHDGRHENSDSLRNGWSRDSGRSTRDQNRDLAGTSEPWKKRDPRLTYLLTGDIGIRPAAASPSQVPCKR